MANNDRKAECKSKKGVALTGQASIEIHIENKNAYTKLILNIVKILKEKIAIIELKIDPCIIQACQLMPKTLKKIDCK